MLWRFSCLQYFRKLFEGMPVLLWPQKLRNRQRAKVVYQAWSTLPFEWRMNERKTGNKIFRHTRKKVELSNHDARTLFRWYGVKPIAQRQPMTAGKMTRGACVWTFTRPYPNCLSLLIERQKQGEREGERDRANEQLSVQTLFCFSYCAILTDSPPPLCLFVARCMWMEAISTISTIPFQLDCRLLMPLDIYTYSNSAVKNSRREH